MYRDEDHGLYAVEEDVEAYEDPFSGLEAVFEGGDPFQDEGAGFLDGDDDDDLLDALDEALDEIEAEQRSEAVQEAAAPKYDVSELEEPSIEITYRRHIDTFLGERRDLPSQAPRRRRPIMDTQLADLLQNSMTRARNALEQRRAKVWISSSGE